MKLYYFSGLGCPLVKHSAASVMGAGFNFPCARAYLRFTSRDSTLTGKQFWLCAVRLQQTVSVLRSVVDTCGLILRLQTWRSITNGRSEAKNLRRGLRTRLANLPTAPMCKHVRAVYNKKAQHRSWHTANCNKLYHLKWNINAWDTAISLRGRHLVRHHEIGNPICIKLLKLMSGVITHNSAKKRNLCINKWLSYSQL